ncbi:MAG: MFS transporter [Luteitalea sp.]|nr:MFS transporter [Luteitalea sp.]
MTSSSLSRAQVHVAFTAFAALFSIVGLALYGLPFFYDFMVRDFGWTRAQVTSGNAYSKLIVGPLFGFLAGWLVDRFGPRRLMLVGIAMAGIALIGLGFISTLTGFYLFYLFNALGYVCGGPLPNQVLLSRWFDRGRGKAMGFAYLGIGVGGAVVPLLAVFLINQLGWQPALQILGVLLIACALPLAWFVKDKPDPAPEHRCTLHAANLEPRTSNLEPQRLPPAHAGNPGASFSPVLRAWPFYLLLIASMCSIGAVGGTMQNLKLYLSLDLEYSQQSIGYIASLVLVGSIIGRLLMGWLADRWPKKYVMLLIYSIVASAIPLLFFAQSQPMLYLFALVFGIGLGGDYMIIPLMAAELFGVAVLGRVMGIVLTADGAAEALAPMAVAAIRDRTGSYGDGFLILVLLAALGAAAVALLPRGQHARGEA